MLTIASSIEAQIEDCDGFFSARVPAATKPEVSELIPQEHPEWQNLRSGKVTGSSLAETLGLFEQCAGKALSGAGVLTYMRDHNKLLFKVTSLQNPKQTPAAVDAQTQVYFEWGHKHEANGILSYLCDNPTYAVHEVGFVLLDPSLQRLPEEVRRGIDPADLPVIGSSPDGIVVQHEDAVTRKLYQHWRDLDPVHRLVLEIKAKTPFRPDPALGIWHWLGKSCKPYVRILPQYFAQAQLNMLVTDSQACHLVCYTVKGGSAMFTIPLHKQWCNQMLHWVAQLNTHYILKGLKPPENVFWEQEAYQQFVKLTKEACEGLGSSRVSMPSQHGPEFGPLFRAPAMEAQLVPNTPEETSSQPSQQQHAQQHPPHWQGQKQQQQQQQHYLMPVMPFPEGMPVPAHVADSTQGPTMPTSAPPLHLLATAALPLPDEDTHMKDVEGAHVEPGPQGFARQPHGQPQQPSGQKPQNDDQQGSHLDLASPVGPHGLASWMQRVLHQLGVDLKSLLDAPCQKALSLLAAIDVVGALERVARDVKAGWPKNPSAVCMHQIRHLQPPGTLASSPGAVARSPGQLPFVAASSPGTSSTSPGILTNRGTSLPASGVVILGPISARRQLWPNKGIAHRPASVDWSPGAGPGNGGLHIRQFHGVANSPVLFQGPPVALVSMEQLGGRPVPAMSQRIKVRLHDVVAKCSSYLREEDFDALILDRLSRMPEWRAMSVLQQAEDANWPVVQNNTRMIMSWCKKHDI
ncbi:hypothetical protein WJX77_005565 [Trebouxia sp. C0004]